MPGEEHILWRLWHAVGRAEFWVEAGERLLLVLALFLLAKILLALARLIIRGAARTRLRDQRVTTLAIMVQSLARYVVIFAAVLVGLYILGVPTAHLLAGLGIGGLALALGVQNFGERPTLWRRLFARGHHGGGRPGGDLPQPNPRRSN